MSCNDFGDANDAQESRPDSGLDVDIDSDVVVERRVELGAPPEVVWDELPAVLGDEVELVAEPGGALRSRGPDGERIGVVSEAEPAERLAFRWMTVDGDEPPSEVEITLERSAVGTMLHLRETRLDGAHLGRSALRACARAGVRA
jgi:uncharacterized protein YndB with AHSA1/START domain